jgi:peptidoglycan/LPS O-acetylase OafA/YrhL
MRHPGLDSLRAIAVIWTMLFHSFLVGGLGEDWAWLQRYGWMGVDLFFVLSGFLIGAQVLAPLARGERFSFGDFWLRRAFRILPAFWAVLAVYLLWPEFREARGMEPWWAFAGFFVNLTIDYGRNAAFSHAWSLCVEEHFYLLFPLLALGFARLRSGAALAMFCVALVLGGIALRSAIWLHFDALAPDYNWFVEEIYYPTWNRLDGLLAGVLLAVWKTYRPDAWSRAAARANLVFVAGLATMALSFWLFRERAGFLGNSVGWPVLSLLPGRGLAGRGVVQPVSGAQAGLRTGRGTPGRCAGPHRQRLRGVRGLWHRIADRGGAAPLRGGAAGLAAARALADTVDAQGSGPGALTNRCAGCVPVSLRCGLRIVPHGIAQHRHLQFDALELAQAAVAFHACAEEGLRDRRVLEQHDRERGELHSDQQVVGRPGPPERIGETGEGGERSQVGQPDHAALRAAEQAERLREVAGFRMARQQFAVFGGQGAFDHVIGLAHWSLLPIGRGACASHASAGS